MILKHFPLKQHLLKILKWFNIRYSHFLDYFKFRFCSCDWLDVDHILDEV